MTDREAMKMALNTLIKSQPLTHSSDAIQELMETIRMLRQALAQPEQEPVAWLEYDSDDYLFLSGKREGAFPVFTASPSKPWVSLTDEELKEIQFSRDTQVEYVTYDEGEDHFEIDIFPENFARAIEAKLKEKNK